MAFNGRDEGLFRAAICQSGTALANTSQYKITFYPSSIGLLKNMFDELRGFPVTHLNRTI